MGAPGKTTNGRSADPSAHTQAATVALAPLSFSGGNTKSSCSTPAGTKTLPPAPSNSSLALSMDSSIKKTWRAWVMCSFFARKERAPKVLATASGDAAFRASRFEKGGLERLQGRVPPHKKVKLAPSRAGVGTKGLLGELKALRVHPRNVVLEQQPRGICGHMLRDKVLPVKVGKSSQARNSGSAEGGARSGRAPRAAPPTQEPACLVTATGPSAIAATLPGSEQVGGMIRSRNCSGGGSMYGRRGGRRHLWVTSAAPTAAESERSLAVGSVRRYTWATWPGQCRGRGPILGQTSNVSFFVAL